MLLAEPYYGHITAGSSEAEFTPEHCNLLSFFKQFAVFYKRC